MGGVEGFHGLESCLITCGVQPFAERRGSQNLADKVRLKAPRRKEGAWGGMVPYGRAWWLHIVLPNPCLDPANGLVIIDVDVPGVELEKNPAGIDVFRGARCFSGVFNPGCEPGNDLLRRASQPGVPCECFVGQDESE